MEPSPRGGNSALGTWPGCARIGGGRYPSGEGRWGLEEARLQGWALLCVGGVVMEMSGFLLAEVAAGAGPWGSAGGAGRRRDEELEEAAGRCPPRRVLGTATPQVRRAVGSRLGLWAGSGGGAGPPVGRAGGLAGGGTRREARGSSAEEAGTPGLKLREGMSIILIRAWRGQAGGRGGIREC